MTLSAPTFPLSEADALLRLQDGLGNDFSGPTDEDSLLRALTVDGVTVGGDFHARPWATARRLIIKFTPYQVTGGGLDPQIDRDLRELSETQTRWDAMAGILHLLPSTGEDWGQGQSGAVPTEAVW